MKNTNWNIRITPGLLAWAREQAALKEQSLSEYVRFLIEHDRAQKEDRQA